MAHPKIIDLFAGPGGWDTGLGFIGRTDVLGIEWDTAACETARAAGHEREQADIAELDPSDYGPIEGLIGSPPCQGFSLAGKGHGREDSALIIAAVGDFASGFDPRDTLRSKVKDDRSVLALEPLRWALELEPEWMTWEQVPAVLPLWEACAVALRSAGYSVWTGLVQAEQYGVPQTRKRAILTASRVVEVDGPVPTHSRYYPRTPEKVDPGVEKWVSMADALSWGMADRPSYTFCNSGHGGTGAEWGGSSVRRAMREARDSGDPKRWIPVAANAGTTPEDMGWTDRRPSPTIIGSFAPDVVAAPGYRGPGDGPRQKAKGSVRVTVQEAGILQSFPADYAWRGSKTAQYRQVGDAVPPLLAAHILASVGAGSLVVDEVA